MRWLVTLMGYSSSFLYRKVFIQISYILWLIAFKRTDEFLKEVFKLRNVENNRSPVTVDTGNVMNISKSLDISKQTSELV